MRTLSEWEVGAVVEELRRRGKKSKNARQNLIIFRLSCCCGLRRAEIAALELRDVLLSGQHSEIVVRRGKGGKRRIVPLGWSPGAVADLQRWCDERRAHGAHQGSPLICDVRKGSYGLRLDPNSIARRWRTGIKILGAVRRRQLSIHKGRHTFCSKAVRAKGLSATRDAAGHASVATTNIYLHAQDDDSSPVFHV